jgi:DNA replication initiation complex subunit (GINS family)
MYDELYRVWRLEKTSEIPQPLPNDFYSRAAAYLKALDERDAYSNAHALQDHLTLREREVGKRLVDEIKQTRLRKITNSSLKGKSINFQDLTNEEKTLVESLKTSTAAFDAARISSHKVDFSPARTELAIVRFLQDIPEIVGVDLNIYGPYKKEDVGSLPKQNAEAFIKQGAAKSVDVR